MTRRPTFVAGGSNTGNQRSQPTPPEAPIASIDHVTLLCEPQEHFIRWAETMNNIRIMEERPQTYSDSWNLPDYGLFMQKSGRFFHGNLVLYLVNPSRVPNDFIAEVLTEHLIPERVTRVDATVDVPVDLSECSFNVSRRKRCEYISAGGKVESVAFGTRGKDGYLRGYDKGRLEGTLDPWWRVECEHKPRVGSELLPDDLFDSLSIGVYPDHRDIPLEDFALVQLARSRPSFTRQLSSRTQRRIKALTRQYVRPLQPSPGDVYREALPELRTYVESLLALGERRGLS
jgi:hypothetical protein